MDLTRKGTAVLLAEFWNEHPENRVDESIISRLEKLSTIRFDSIAFVDSSQSPTFRYVFQVESVAKDYYRSYWWLLSTDRTMIFEIGIANCNGSYDCDLCLKSVLFMDNPEGNFMNRELPKDKKVSARKSFEKDILAKLVEQKRRH